MDSTQELENLAQGLAHSGFLSIRELGELKFHLFSIVFVAIRNS